MVMNVGRILSIVLVSVFVVANCGCVSQELYDDVRAQNRIQQDRISDLEGQISAAGMEIEQLQLRLDSLRGRNSADLDSRDDDITALENDIARKKALIEKMQAQLLRSGVALPMELNVMLQEFAASNDMVTFDEATGTLRFKSDLLFNLGSDQVAADAMKSIKALCNIMNSKQGGQFDVVVAGHTDDVRIGKPETKAKHPTNWHLSVHRAISVLNVMTQNKVTSTRLSVRGFGEFRPAESNKPDKKGNAANRRVEIFIVPSGA